MALAALIPGLKATAEIIGEFRDVAPALMEWLKGVQSKFTGGNQFLQFARIARLGDPTLTLKEISPMYQSAKYFLDELYYQNRLTPNTPIDRRLATPVKSASGLSSGGTTLRYRVNLIVTGLPDGTPLVHSHWIGTNYERSRAELLDMAKRAEMRRWKPAYTPESEGGEGPELDFDIEITAFERFYA